MYFIVEPVFWLITNNPNTLPFPENTVGHTAKFESCHVQIFCGILLHQNMPKSMENEPANRLAYGSLAL